WEYPEEKGSKPVMSRHIDVYVRGGCNSPLNLEQQFIDQYKKEHPHRYTSLHRIQVIGPYNYHDPEANRKQKKTMEELYNEFGLIMVEYIVFQCGYKSKNQKVAPDESPESSKSDQGYITVEKKDTKFQEAETKRILEEKKAEVQRQVKLQAIKNQATPQQKERIKKVLIGSSRQ